MTETSWHSYPSIYAIGHRALTTLLDDPVVVQEKVDGSQFSFGIFEGNESFPGGLRCRSKGAEIHIEAPERMFEKAVATAQLLKDDLVPGWTYRGEYLQKPKHNSLAYDRVPQEYIILFDVNTGYEEYMGPSELAAEAARLGLESVPLLYHGKLSGEQVFRDLLDRTSILGGQKIEGVVIKNYSQFGPDKKALMGKFVSEAFKEIHVHEWKQSNPGHGDILQMLISSYRTPARWGKAVQHLQETGQLEGSPRDIGALIKETHEDIEKECADEIAAKLYAWAIPSIRRGATAGLAEWYKDELVKAQFDG